jgi:hypothetical protein
LPKIKSLVSFDHRIVFYKPSTLTLIIVILSGMEPVIRIFKVFFYYRKEHAKSSWDINTQTFKKH